MKVRWVSRAIFVVAFLVGSAQAFPQTGPPITEKRFAPLGNRAPAPTIEEIADPRVLAATEEEISTGIVDSVNLLVMDMDLCVRCGNCSRSNRGGH